MKWQEITGLFKQDFQDDIDITHIAYDSRKVQEGSLFVCIPGGTVDGHEFAQGAVEKGAKALVVERYVENIPGSIPQLKVDNARLALADIAEAFYGYPSGELRIFGVTGTNGKTTTTHLIKEILDAYGAEAGLIGTNHILIGNEIIPASGTTPESLEISGYLRNMVKAGCDYGIMEVSSHGLKQGRVSALSFAGAAFTNLTQDHLDYHHDFADYLAAKQKLFKGLTGDSFGIINIDDPYGTEFQKVCGVKTITYGLCDEADYMAKDIAIEHNGTSFTLIRRGENFKVYIPLLGKFNVYNALATIAMVESEGLPIDFIIKTLAEVKQVRGRFEKVKSDFGPVVIVDYAHSPDGLENILNTAVEMKKARLILVFGCGGDRDKAKRPIMGRIGGSKADIAVITSDNPRTEDPDDIIAMVEAGVKESGGNYIVESDRRAAINKAIAMAEDDDLVVIAGKGHEDYQIIGTKKIHFDDFEEAEKALLSRKNRDK